MNATTMNVTWQSKMATITINNTPSFLSIFFHKNKNIVVLFLFLLVSFKSHAQNFNYSVVTQTSSFVFLNDSLPTLNNNIIWDDNTYPVAIGFTFTFAGQTFDSVKIQTNGTLTFDNLNKYNFMGLFKNFMSELDSMDHAVSPIIMQLTTLSSGFKQLKIEFENAKFYTAAGVKVHTNFQIWLNQQNNTIEFHMGSTDVALTAEATILGLLNTRGGGVSLGYLLQGNPVTPTGVLIPSGGNVVQLTAFPANETVYVFTAN
jgi:hypothetical protein